MNLILMLLRWGTGMILAAAVGGSFRTSGTADVIPLGEPVRVHVSETGPETSMPAGYPAYDVQHVKAGPQLRRICRVTAYADWGVTAAGVPSGLGQCAAPADIPLGSLAYIPALDVTLVVTDRTARRFRRNTVDVFLPSRQQCRQFGRAYLEVIFTVPASATAPG